MTEEIAPGCRASTTSYIASMLRPEVIRDLDLAGHGLQMVPCDPALLVPFADGTVAPWWSDRERTVRELAKLSPADARTFVRVDDELKRLARYLQPFFLEPPPDVHARGLAGRDRGAARGPALPRDLGRRDRADGLVPDGQPRRLSRPQLRVGEGQDALPRQQRLRQARRPVLAGDRARPALPPPVGRRARAAGLLRPRDRRHGRDHAGDGLGRAASSAPRSARRRPSRRIARARRPRARRRARGRHGDRRAGRGLQRRSQAHVPRPRRAERSCPRTSAARSPGSRWTGPARRSTSCCPRSRASTACRREFEKSAARALHARALARVRRALLRHRQARARSRRSSGSTASSPRTWTRASRRKAGTS